MARRSRPWSRNRARRPGAWRFAGVVAAVAALAFYLTLNWPFGISTGPDGALGTADMMGGRIDRGDLTCTVAHITDGDTLRCQDGVRIRLHAVAARERDGSCSPGHPCPRASAQAATNELRRLAEGRTIRCQTTGRSHNRITAICWTPEGEEINCALVRSGVALIWERFHRDEALCRA